MPKEYINNRWYGQKATQYLEDADGKQIESQVSVSDAAVKVGWSKSNDGGGLVEVAVVLLRSGVGNPDMGAEHSHMDRDGINRLIRTLRKARDAAFGADA
ncbi:hypothetical protein ACIRON_02650 [Nocardioides sp. NPDC101246]|uniref:hypothetical protein n=1 Tax=Nocardioides sp. NPDC101246 TaxID=3364336 RepID=UPI0038062323